MTRKYFSKRKTPGDTRSPDYGSGQEQIPDLSDRKLIVPGLVEKINHFSKYPWIRDGNFVKIHFEDQDHNKPFRVKKYEKLITIIDEENVEYELDNDLNKKIKESSIKKIPLSSLLLTDEQQKLIMHPVANLRLTVFDRSHSDIDYVEVRILDEFREDNVNKANALLKDESNMTTEDHEWVRRIVHILKLDGQTVTTRSFLQLIFGVHYFPAILYEPDFDLNQGLPIVGLEGKLELFHRPEYKRAFLDYLRE